MPYIHEMKTFIGIASIAMVSLIAPLQAAVCDGVSPVVASNLVSVVAENGLTGKPLLVTAPPGDRDRIFIVEQDGLIWVKHRGSALGVRSVYLDLTAIAAGAAFEQGLLGLEWAPDFDTSGLFYVSYAQPQGSGVTRLVTYEQDPLKPDQANPTPLGTFFSLNQPQSNHNGGNIQIGSDGFLYLGLGDGGGSDDSDPSHGVCGNGQDDSTLLGKMIRIDPTGNSPNPPDCGTGTYTIPDGNPFADGPGGVCDEIWAIGLRNPWRWTFDPANDDLYIADVGQDCWEEINWVPSTSTGGENYGWRSMEGTHCFDPTNSTECDPAAQFCAGAVKCDAPGLTLPVLESPQSSGACSVTGGYVYRGCRIANLQGHYFWSDFCDGKINSFLIDTGVPTLQTDWTASVDPSSILAFDMSSFGRDGEGELYAIDRDGVILKLVPPLSDFEVSGSGVLDVDLLDLERNANWTWEDLEFNSMHPIEYYSIYRGTPGGIFDCIHSTTATDWIGDPADPGPGQVTGYLVTATNGTGVESGAGSGRTLNLTCSAPPTLAALGAE
jgi:glucose/arabinose dehydrogenase